MFPQDAISSLCSSLLTLIKNPRLPPQGEIIQKTLPRKFDGSPASVMSRLGTISLSGYTVTPTTQR